MQLPIRHLVASFSVIVDAAMLSIRRVIPVALVLVLIEHALESECGAVID